MDRWRMTGGCVQLLHQPQSTRASTPIGIRSARRSHDAWDTCTYALLTTANSHANVDILRPGFPVRKQRDDRRVVEAILARIRVADLLIGELSPIPSIVDFAIGDSLTFRQPCARNPVRSNWPHDARSIPLPSSY
ncbi:hypothetical protein FA13DRAFT_1318676 [Coprinellus micaceus]|uniref:Uncharacterized protein n=1 Tax=Coprinellus micaceus TaxID=71717 RepID=A0A4Y7SRD2_COPMI|nr:hypothetical protein FA13DRAFT_1318676 [Coprinellus micaceus]